MALVHLCLRTEHAHDVHVSRWSGHVTCVSAGEDACGGWAWRRQGSPGRPLWPRSLCSRSPGFSSFPWRAVGPRGRKPRGDSLRVDWGLQGCSPSFLAEEESPVSVFWASLPRLHQSRSLVKRLQKEKLHPRNLACHSHFLTLKI